MIKKEYGCFSEENFDNLIGYNLKGKKTSENETIPINSYSYNANYKACHINVDNTCTGYIEFPFEQFSIGDVIEVEFECLTKENHVVVLFSSDSNKRVVPKTNYFTKYKCNFLVTENIKDRIKIGLGYANAGEFYIRNIKYSTIKKEYKFSKIKLEKDYCIRKNANTWEIGRAHV